jgi:hypothetical protein
MQELDFTPPNSPSASDRVDLPVNPYSHWKYVSLNWTGLCYCVLWLLREIRQNVRVTVLGEVTPYSLVDKSMSLHLFDAVLTTLHGVTCGKKVIFTFNVLWFTTLRNR